VIISDHLGGQSNNHLKDKLCFKCIPVKEWIDDDLLAFEILKLRNKSFSNFSPEDNHLNFYLWMKNSPYRCESIIVKNSKNELIAHMGFAEVEMKLIGKSHRVITIFDSMVNQKYRKQGLYQRMLNQVIQNIAEHSPVIHFPLHPVYLDQKDRYSFKYYRLKAALPYYNCRDTAITEVSSEEAFQKFGDPRSKEYLQWRYNNSARIYRFFKIKQVIEGESIIVLRNVFYRRISFWLVIDCFHGYSEILPKHLSGSIFKIMKEIHSIIFLPFYGKSEFIYTVQIPVFIRRTTLVVHANEVIHNFVKKSKFFTGSKLSY
jgi:hypothetical protein